MQTIRKSSSDSDIPIKIREELKVNEENPLEIQDYTTINSFEKLIKALEIPIIKWNMSDNSHIIKKENPNNLSEKFTEEFIFRNFLNAKANR